MMKATLLVFCAGLASCGGSSGSGSIPTGTYDAFANATTVVIHGYSGDAMEPFISKDGQFLFFNNRNDPSVDTNLFYAARVDDTTFTLQGPVAGANSPQLDAVASLDALGNLYFISTRSYSTSLSTVYSGPFTSGGVSSVALVPGISQLKSGIVNFDAEISGDGQTLWFADGDYSTGSLTAASIIIADKLAAPGAGFARRANSSTLLALVNNADLNYAPSISADGLELFFTRVSTLSGATPAIYRATRSDLTSAFSAPELVTGASGFVEAPSLSADGHLLYFHRMVNGTFVIQVLKR
jgi:Tol biopolymer transport system component